MNSILYSMQGSRDTPRTPAQHGHSSSGNVSDSGIGHSFFPPDFTEEAFVSTTMTSEPPLDQDQDNQQSKGGKPRLRRWVKFVLFWILVTGSILTVHYGIEQFNKLKSILTERIEKMDSISLFYIAVGFVFMISVIVNMFCLDRKSCKLPQSVLSPVPPSGLSKCKGGLEKSMKKHLDNSGYPMESVSSTREFPCRRTFSGQGADVWHDFRRYFENISQLNN